jgi:tetratricopeptide (TPR) repeat protein
MDIAGSIIESHPDSALAILDSFITPSLLDKARYHHYMLLRLQAKDKSYQDITEDTAIFNTKHYYTEKNDLPSAAMAAYYCGRVRFEQKDYKSAMTQYVEAERYAANILDINLKALIQSAMGAALAEQMLAPQALLHLQQAREYFHQAKNLRNEMISYQLVGNSYLTKGETDSALYYYNKTLQMAESLNDSIQISGAKQNIGILYKEIEEDYPSAKQYFFAAMKYTEGNDYARICLKLADIYSTENKKDSAEWYLQQAISFLQNKKDTYMVADVYNTTAIIKERELDYKASTQYYKLYADYQDSIFKETRNAALINIEKKYKFEQLKNENMGLVMEKQRIILYSAIGGLLSLFVIMLFYRRNTLIKKQELEAEQKVYRLMDMAKTFDEKEQSFRSILLRQFDIVKKTATLSSYIRKEDEKSNKLLKKFNEIVYGKEGLNWDVLYETLNDLQSGFFEHLRERFPDLAEDEFRICCLTYADFSREEIGIIMEMSVSSVQSKRNIIRKKLGIPSTGKINTFLAQDVSLS